MCELMIFSAAEEEDQEEKSIYLSLD